MLNKSDRKHIELMKKSIQFFEEEDLNLDSLLRITRSLEELLDELKQVNDSWKETFRTEWWSLEIHSSQLMAEEEENDEEISELTEESKKFILNAINNIKALIDQILKENPIGEEDSLEDHEEVLKLTDSDKKQLEIMKKNIQFFEQTNPNLDSLTKTSHSLKDHLDSLQNVDNKWRKAFRSEWWILEFVYSITQDQKTPTLTKENKEKVLKASSNMKAMIEGILTKKD